MKSYNILSINPGSTSTKIGVFNDENCVFEINVSHSQKQLDMFSKIWDQYSFRKEEIILALERKGFSLDKLDAVVGRGGLVKPIPSGIYYIEQDMIEDARNGLQGHHASNLGCVIAYSIAWEYSIPALIVDPPSVNDFEPLAKISGHKMFERESLLHALNIFAVAHNYAKTINKKISELNLIVAHLGGGITVAALRKGKAINVNNGLYEGPFSPERSGSLPLFQIIEMCMSEKYSKKKIKKMIVGRGGLVSYFNTNKAKDVEKMVVAGSQKYRLVYEAMAYQIAEEIGKRATNLKGKTDAILLTGGIAYSKILTSWIKERVEFISKVHIFPGEKELEALAKGALRVLRGEERAKRYTQEVKKIGIIYWDNLKIYITAINTIENKFKKAGYVFRKEINNMHIKYMNCKREEDSVIKAVNKFKKDNVDLIFAVGSPISVRLGQYLKNDDTPVIFTGIYNSAVIDGFEKEQNKNFYATCYAFSVEEQFKNTILKIEPEIEKIGILYRRGELQSEIQYDDLKEYCRANNIGIAGFEIQSSDDFVKAKNNFLKKNVKWVYIGADTVTASANYEELNIITESFPTVCMLEDTIQRGGTIGYVVPWKNVCSDAVDLALDIFDRTEIKSRVNKPKIKSIVVNKKNAEKHNILKKINEIKNVKFIS